MYVLSGEGFSDLRRSQDSKVRHILYQAPLHYFGTMQWVGVGVACMPRYINMQKQTQEHKCLS